MPTSSAITPPTSQALSRTCGKQVTQSIDHRVGLHHIADAERRDQREAGEQRGGAFHVAGRAAGCTSGHRRFLRPASMRRNCNARVHSVNLVAMPKKAVTHIQNRAPGPPSEMAVATPAMLPVPTVADNAVARAWKC